MNNQILQVAEVLKKEKWFLIFMFTVCFISFYFAGYFSKIIASDWIWTKEFEEMYPNSPDLERIESLLRMVLRGDVVKAYATLWLFSPILVSLVCTLGMMKLNYAITAKNKQGKKHIAEFIMVGLLGIVIATFLYNRFIE